MSSFDGIPFDYKWLDNIDFEMIYKADEDADEPHWTEVEFNNIVGDLGKGKAANQLDLKFLTEECKIEIRKLAYDFYQNKAKRDYETEGCDAYHRMKDDANA